MKSIKLIICIFLLWLSANTEAHAQKDEIAQLVLNVQKLAQFKQILKDMKKGYEILEGGYSNVRDISKGNFNLHKEFLDGLSNVSPAVRNYRRVADIVICQQMMVKEYRIAYDRFAKDKNFSEKELGYIAGVYDNLLKGSLRNLDELSGVITAGKMRMSDDERLQSIDRIYFDMEDKLLFLRSFNNSTTVLSVQRSREQHDVNASRKLNGINK